MQTNWKFSFVAHNKLMEKALKFQIIKSCKKSLFYGKDSFHFLKSILHNDCRKVVSNVNKMKRGQSMRRGRDLWTFMFTYPLNVDPFCTKYPLNWSSWLGSLPPLVLACDLVPSSLVFSSLFNICSNIWIFNILMLFSLLLFFFFTTSYRFPELLHFLNTQTTKQQSTFR